MEAPLPFLPSQSSEEKLSGAGGVTINLFLDSTGALRRRPGIVESDDLYDGIVDEAGIDGVYAGLDGAVYAVAAGTSSRGVYRVTNVVSELSTTGDTRIDSPRRPTFAETEILLTIATGGQPQKVILSTGDSSRLLGSPPNTSHIVSHGLRLSANDATLDKTKVRYTSPSIGTTDYSGHEQWLPGTGSAGFFTAEARPDPIVALHENTSELFAFGSTSLQVYAPDPQFIYAPVNTREHGCIAPYSIVRTDQSFAWLDDKRRFVLSDGRSVQVLSLPIKQDIDALSVVSDAYGYRVLLGPLDALVWTFPTDGRTFVYQQGGGWSQWSGKSGTGYAPFSVLSHTFRNQQNVVGLSTGQVAELSLEAKTDLGENILCTATTGFVDRGTSSRKHCRAVHFTLRLDTADDAEVFLAWRDDEGSWGNPLRAVINRNQPVVSLRSLGVYRKRQWRLSFSGSGDFALADAREEFDVLSA